MMLESMVTPFGAKRRPWEMFFIALLYYCVACLLAIWAFKEYASVIALIFTVIAVLPLIYNTIREEEEEAVKSSTRKAIMSHSKYFMFTMFFFSGLIVASTLWYVFSPANWLHSLFEAQLKTLGGVPITGRVSSLAHFSVILFNNLKVLMFCVAASAVYGAGAIFILTWNASVIGAAIGAYIRSKLAALTAASGFHAFAQYLGVFSIGLTKYVIHGIPEILAYFIGGLAGGIISVGVVRKEYKTYNFSTIFMDASYLILLAIAITFVAAVLEVWVTPAIFN